MSRSEFILEEDTYMVQYTEEVAAYCDPFCCGDEELDSFFEEQVFLYEKELLCKSYCWINRNNDKEIIAIATFSYDSIKSYTLDNSSRNALQRKIPHRKRHRSYPAMLIGRLGVNQVYRGKGLNIGTQVMDLVKILCVNDEGMGICRYLLVDAYNTDATLHFYLKNGFKLLYKTEESEREMFEISYEESLRSRIMYFDLKLIKT
ncbi:MAG: GNAT family N-acetyltransferase [Muribaculaceae bacterium]|nr:GNAT family N-acetyltransferase [Muribaculaceae bacterium]